MFLPRLPHADVKLLLFAPDATRSVKGETQTQQTNRTKQGKHKEKRRVPFVGLSYVKLCDTAASVH